MKKKRLLENGNSLKYFRKPVRTLHRNANPVFQMTDLYTLTTLYDLSRTNTINNISSVLERLKIR